MVEVNRIKGLEQNVCLYIKYQPPPTCKRIIRIYRLNVMASRFLTTFMWFDSGNLLPVVTLIKMSKPLT